MTEFSFAELDAPPITIRDIADPIAAALVEAERLREDARDLGFAEGREAGLDAARAEMAPVAAAFGQALAELRGGAVSTAESVERASVELALSLAEKLLAGTLDVQPERIVDVVRGTLRRLVERERVLVLVNPDDLEHVRDATAALIAELGGIEHCEVQAERRVGRGGAIVRTAEGEVDARVETQLGRAREIMAAELSAS
jgi:flagellar biosynthesis/type III secretory pathway protein FliH